MKENLLALGGAVVGGLAGYFAFFWIASQGFYGIVLPGALLGLGAGLFRNNSIWICIACGIAALTLGLFTEWRFAPFTKDTGLVFFLLHFYQLRPVTLIMIAASGAIAFYGTFRNLNRNPTKSPEAQKEPLLPTS